MMGSDQYSMCQCHGGLRMGRGEAKAAINLEDSSREINVQFHVMLFFATTGYIEIK